MFRVVTSVRALGVSAANCAKRLAFNVTPFERAMVLDSLTDSDVKKAFTELDEQHAGKIDVMELSKVLQNDTAGVEQFLGKMIDHIDLDTTGTLNFAEFLVLMVKNFGVNGVQDAFLSYDVDGSGSITRDELKEWMTRHGRFLTRRQVAMMIDAVDVNDDGEIDYEEFLMLVCRRVLRMKAVEVEV